MGLQQHRPRRLSVLLCATALSILAACSGQEPPLDEQGQDDTTGVVVDSAGDGDGEPGDGDGEPGDGDGEPGDGDGDGEPPAPGECGDSILDPGESCDDGNLEAGDGCSQGCSIEGLVIPCGDKIWACGDGIDNDGDGEIDTDDPECISPCDDNELAFATDIPGGAEDCKSDCFFDGNSGMGNDLCEWSLECDPENPGAQIGCEYDPQHSMCELEMPPECLDFCEPLVPNGCDCFGCCEIAGDFYYLDSSTECALDNLGACETCTFFAGCNNPCEPELCELCFGQDPNELPEECTDPGCDGDEIPCENSAECDEGWYCQTGCCVPIIEG